MDKGPQSKWASSKQASTFKYESFNQRFNQLENLLVYYWSLVRDLHKKNMKLVGGWSFPLKENWYFPVCNTVRFLLVGCLVEVADKIELLGLLFDFFGRTLHASWKQKNSFVMFAPWLNDWVNERRVQTVCLWGKICMKLLHCFGAGMLFICNLHSVTFPRKSTVLPSIFLHCSNAKQILLH